MTNEEITKLADKYIGHPKEVDEGYEVTGRRQAYIDGFKKALSMFDREQDCSSNVYEDSNEPDYIFFMDL